MNIQVDPTSSNLASAMLNSKIRPRAVVGNFSSQSSELRHQITCIFNLLKAREKSRVHGGIGFDFASHWLKNWRESFKPIIKRTNRNHVITFDSHLKTALTSMKGRKGIESY